jgi:hypothetical protein
MAAMADKLGQQMGRAPGEGMGPVGTRPGQNPDPFGRNPGNGNVEAVEGVEIPDEMERRRTREILDELRRRRGERHRPPLELEYIDRLIERF